MRVIILGGGFIGQLLHAFWPKARVFDWASEAPAVPTRQLGPQYLWEQIPELPCRQFSVYTMIDGQAATDASMLAYKMKVGKEQDGSDWRAQFQPRMDGWSCTLPRSRVEYGKSALAIDLAHRLIILGDSNVERFDVLMSTLPMPTMLKLVGWISDLRHFQSRPIFMHTAETDPWQDDMHVNYLSSPETPVYRQTLREGLIYTESLHVIPGRTVRMTPGKIYRNDLSINYIARLAQHGIASFGRYAVWEPDELAHETLRKARIFKRDILP